MCVCGPDLRSGWARLGWEWLGTTTLGGMSARAGLVGGGIRADWSGCVGASEVVG